MKWAIVAAIVICNTAGDLLNAKGMRRHGPVHAKGPAGVARLILALTRNPLVLGGVAAMGIAFFALLALLSITDLSFAVPATAASYMLETLLAKLVLKEDVRKQRWAGACLVMCGVVLLSLQ